MPLLSLRRNSLAQYNLTNKIIHSKKYASKHQKLLFITFLNMALFNYRKGKKMRLTYPDCLGHDTVQTGNWSQTFRKNILPQYKKYCMTVTPTSNKNADLFETSAGLTTYIIVQCNYVIGNPKGSYTRHKTSSVVTATTHLRDPTLSQQ
jgi:hypothetical protein